MKPLIEKKILHAGTANVQFESGTKVYFHFQTKLCNEEKTLLDDTRKMGQGKPMELIIGKKFTLAALEEMVKNMSLNEVAHFTVDKSLCLQYPVVAKTLRDLDKPTSQRNRHCCGMMLQNEGLGYKDLNDFIKNPTDLEFTIELLKVLSPDEYQKESWQLNEEEKAKIIPVLKEEGNKAFKEKDYKNAEHFYTTAIGYLEQLMLKEKPHGEEWLALEQQKVPFLSNLAQCKLYEKDYYSVIECCTNVLKSEPNNVKALFRRAKAHIGAWNPEEARKDLLKVKELDNTLTTVVNEQLTELENQIKERVKEEKEKMQKLF